MVVWSLFWCLLTTAEAKKSISYFLLLSPFLRRTKEFYFIALGAQPVPIAGSRRCLYFYVVTCNLEFPFSIVCVSGSALVCEAFSAQEPTHSGFVLFRVVGSR